MGIESELVAVTIIETKEGLPGTFSKAKSIFKPFLSNAVIDGKPVDSQVFI